MEAKEIDVRLDNWGRWSRSGGRRKRRISAGFEEYYPEEPPEARDPVIQIDDLDAWALDRLIVAVCSPFEKWLLLQSYVRFYDSNWNDRFMEKTLRLRFGTYRSAMDSVKRKLTRNATSGPKP